MDNETKATMGDDLTRRVSRWHRVQHRWLARESKSLRESRDDGADLYPEFPGMLREVHARLLSGDRVQEVPVDQQHAEAALARKLHGALDELPEWHAFMERARGDDWVANIATTAIARELRNVLPQHTHDAAVARELYEQLLVDIDDGMNVPSDTVIASKDKMDLAAKEAIELANAVDEGEVRQALRRALGESQQTANDANSAAMAFGWSQEDAAAAGQGYSSGVKAELARRVEAAPKLRRLAELAGRMKLAAAAIRAAKPRMGCGELSDVEQGADLARLVPSELAALVGPRVRKLLLYRSLVERAALQYRLQDRPPESKGPIVVCVDDSGSMRGEREAWAKALALALVSIARADKRAYVLCTFSKSLHVTVTESEGQRMTPLELVNALTPFAGGGTDWAPPLHWAFGRIAEAASTSTMKQADVIFITDDECNIDGPAIRDLASKLSTRIIGIAIAGQKNLKTFCDVVAPVRGLVAEDDEVREGYNDGAALQAALSV